MSLKKKQNGDLRISLLNKTDDCIKSNLLKDFLIKVNKNDLNAQKSIFQKTSVI